ncbi:RcnB family protein [Dyella sp. Tek66A03]|uniref:RcnB family protein n=1 Tax=Dyella sp. Tek66A03 TaxID=3458298 RepID=UPI00403EE5BE
MLLPVASCAIVITTLVPGQTSRSRFAHRCFWSGTVYLEWADDFIRFGHFDSGGLMKRLFIFVVTAALLAGTAATYASPQDDSRYHDQHRDDDRDHHDGDHRDGDHRDGDRDRGDRGHDRDYREEGHHDNGEHKGWEKQAYRRGERMPDRYYSHEYYVTDYERYHVRRPDPGYRWVRSDDGQIVLTAIASGIIIDVALTH